MQRRKKWDKKYDPIPPAMKPNQKCTYTLGAKKKETTVKLFKWCWQIIIARLCIKYLLGLMRARHHLNRLWHHRTRISLMRVIFIYFDNGLRGVKKNLCFFFFLSCITDSSFDSLNVHNIVFYRKIHYKICVFLVRSLFKP